MFLTTADCRTKQLYGLYTNQMFHIMVSDIEVPSITGYRLQKDRSLSRE